MTCFLRLKHANTNITKQINNALPQKNEKNKKTTRELKLPVKKFEVVETPIIEDGRRSKDKQRETENTMNTYCKMYVQKPSLISSHTRSKTIDQE